MGKRFMGHNPLAFVPLTGHSMGRTVGRTRRRSNRGSDKLVKVHSSGFRELRTTAPPVLCAPHYHADRQGTTRAKPVPFPLMTYVPRAKAYGDTLPTPTREIGPTSYKERRLV